MSVEQFGIGILITGYGLSPEAARAIIVDNLRGTLSLDQRIGKNQSRERIKTLGELIPDPQLPALNIIEQKELRWYLLSLAQESGLTKKQDEAYQLTLNGLKPQEIAKELGLENRQAVRNRLVGALEKIREHLILKQILAELKAEGKLSSLTSLPE